MMATSSDEEEATAAFERAYARYAAEKKEAVMTEELNQLCRQLDGLGPIGPVVVNDLQRQALGDLTRTIREFIAALTGTGYGFTVNYLEAVRGAVLNSTETNRLVRDAMVIVKRLKLKTAEERGDELNNGGPPPLPIDQANTAIEPADRPMQALD